ncbi:MAG: DNA cytosine methyltransferase [Balneolaceae bacterium]|nr:DNA cytosine methyltransferase [Balneolaceae bacterium]
MSSPFRLIDLFSGAGGMTLGFTNARDKNGENFFSPVWANDFNKDSVDTYNANFGEHCVYGDIVDILNDSKVVIPEADIVIGGPPCQGFSLLNKDREIDPRKQLWRPFMDVVEISGARVFVMENVRQLLSSAEIHEIKDVATQLGFEVASEVLCAADYGVPQERYRAFVIGVKNGSSPNKAFPPKKTHYNPKDFNEITCLFDDYIDEPKPWRTVQDAIGDLPEPVGTEIRDESGPLDLHFGRNPTDKSKKRYRAVPPGGNRFDLQKNAPEITPDCWKRKKSGGTDLFGRLWWNRPSVTIRTEFFKPEKGRYLHPVQHRPITHREGARLQTFPDEFQFCGSKIEIARQIGNAVPPLLAEAIARSASALLIEEENYIIQVSETELLYS